MKKLILRDSIAYWHVGYYDNCKCGYACDKHFRVVSVFPKSEISGSHPSWLCEMVKWEIENNGK